MAEHAADFGSWRERLIALTGLLRGCTRDALLSALRQGRLDELARPQSQGVGDVTFGLDQPSERAIEGWLTAAARTAPLSVLTEDTGWRHRGPDGRGGTRELAPFDHGGPRIAIDPVDGTRNLMADLRSAWTVVAFAPAGAGQPRLSDLTGGIVSELPGSLAAGYRCLVSDGSTCLLEVRDLATDALAASTTLTVDDDDRVDNGYFPFFRYEPAQRPAIARLEADFFGRLVQHEGCDARSVYDDQYCSSAGQLVQLALGRYRMVVDAREWVHRQRGAPGVTSKPYDLAGAVVCARAAGAIVTAVEGGPLDFPIDATTPVGFVGYANARTQRRLEGHWLSMI